MRTIVLSACVAAWSCGPGPSVVAESRPDLGPDVVTIVDDTPNPGVPCTAPPGWVWALGPHGISRFELVRAEGTWCVLRMPPQGNGRLFATPGAFVVALGAEASVAAGDVGLLADGFTSVWARVTHADGPRAHFDLEGLFEDEPIDADRFLPAPTELGFGAPIAVRTGDGDIERHLAIHADATHVWWWTGRAPRSQVRLLDLRPERQPGEAVWVVGEYGSYGPGVVDSAVLRGAVYWVAIRGTKRQKWFDELATPVPGWSVE